MCSNVGQKYWLNEVCVQTLDRNVYLLHSEDVCLVSGCFTLYIVDLYTSFLPIYMLDCIFVEKDPLNLLSSVSIGKVADVEQRI